MILTLPGLSHDGALFFLLFLFFFFLLLTLHYHDREPPPRRGPQVAGHSGRATVHSGQGQARPQWTRQKKKGGGWNYIGLWRSHGRLCSRLAE